MALGGEMHDRARAMLHEQTVDRLAVADVAPDEGVAMVALEQCEIAQVPGIRQLVEADDGLADLAHPVENEVGADKTGGAGHENRHCAGLLSALSFAYLWKLFMQPIEM